MLHPPTVISLLRMQLTLVDAERERERERENSGVSSLEGTWKQKHMVDWAGNR
jgi:hypothetical protein